MRADRHIVMGSRGTAIAAAGVVALVDAPTGSPIASAWEALIFDTDAAATLEDRLASLDPESLASFAIVVAVPGATSLVVRGASSMANDGSAIVRHAVGENETWAAIEIAETDGVTLALDGDDAPTGQWLTNGVIAAGSVIVGRLQVPRRRGAAPAPVASDVDFGNLIGRPVVGRVSTVPAADPVVASEAEPEPTQPMPRSLPVDQPARTDATAQFVAGTTFDPVGHLRFSDGQVLPIDRPIVVGRRPPGEAIGDVIPRTLILDDTMLSRHHVTLRVVDGRLVAVDEGSTNGTTVTTPGTAPTRCDPRQPAEVPLGATVDIGGVLTATYESGAAGVLTIDFAGDVVELDGSEPFVVGRDGDLAIADNPYLHRRFLEFSLQHDIWWVTNIGSQTSATVNDPGSAVHAWLAPGGRMPIVHGTTVISFTAGPTAYELLVTLEGAPTDFDSVQSVDDGAATLGRVSLTDDQRLMLVVLAEAALRHGMSKMSDIPSAAVASQRVGWTRKKFEKKIDNVCDRLAGFGVRGLKGDMGNQAVSRRVRLVEYALSSRLVTADDLALLDARRADSGRADVVTALKLTLISSSSRTRVDIEIDAPPDITVGALAAELAARNPHHNGPAASMALVRDGFATPIDPNVGVHESGIASGATVELVEDHTGLELPSEPSAGVATVISGPDAGRSFPLREGGNVVGRDPACEIVLSDQMVSRRHVRIEVTGPVDVVDLGSVNGTIVAGEPVEKARVGPTTEILIGDTILRVHSHRELAAVAAGAFVRSPPGQVPFVADELTAPPVPTKTKAGRIPVIAAIAPLVLGAVMYAMTRRPESLIFIALSPLMLMGNAVEARLSNRRGAKRGTEEFRKKLAEFEATGRERLEAETQARRNEHPDLAELNEALRGRTPTLWSRRPDDDHFAEICVGRARQPTRMTFATKSTGDGQEDLTAELDTVLESLCEVDDVPVVIDLHTEGSVGVAGPPYHARSAVSSMISSLALLHSPAELSIGLMAPEDTAPQWDWLKWLPHADTHYSPFEAQHLASTAATCLALHGTLTGLLEARLGAAGGRPEAIHVPLVVLVIEDEAPIERPLLIELLERGPEAGIHMIWVAGAIDRLPAGCGAVLDVLEGPRSMSLRVRRTKERTDGIRCTVLEPEGLDDVARSLSPIVDVGARTRGDTGLPDVVFGPHLLGLPPTAAPEMLLERWAQTSIEAARHHDTGLRAAVGVAAGEPLVLDLRTQGPHALVGGTTGAGKSEFLQAWVMGLASSYSPQRVNFLFVDYKGGSAFSECVKLPHCVGLVTDLSPHLVDRALTSLHAELHRREHLFGALDAKDIHELERRGAAETPPALIIVIDEFAALVQEVPDFVTGVVNVAQRGRSLGLHLILATQRPAGVITGNLRANTNLRVALRMADESDSTDVIDATDAAYIDAAHPGRGFAKVGPGRTHSFQSAFYGGWSTRASAERKVAVRELSIVGGESWDVRRARSGIVDEPNDLAQLVASTQRAALVGQLANPRRPWLPELPSGLDLRDATLTRSDGEIVFGTCDVPAEQAQPPISFFPDRDGNFAVFGASGTGKSTLLRTIVMVAGSSVERPDSPDGPCHVYCIDFGSRSLQLLEDFPHVGSVIGADDHERIDRLLRELRSTINERQIRFRAADADSIAQYREATGQSSEPRILVLIDNFGAFRQAYDTPGRAALEHLTTIMADGRSVGIHVVLSADRPGAVPSAITSLVPRRLVLRLSNDSDYMLVGERTDVLDSAVPPGRGLEDGREFQIAVLGGTSNLAEQTRLARALARHDGFVSPGNEAPPVRQLPTLVRLDDLPAAVDNRPALGLDDVTLSPIGFEPSGGFLVAGPPGSGRSTAMGTIAVSLRRWKPTFQRVLFAERRSSLTGLARWTTVAERPAEYAELAAAIAADLKQAEGPVAGLAIFVENAPELLEGGEAEAPVMDLIKTALASDVFVVVEGETSLLARAWKLDPIKNQRTGLLLQPQATDGDLLKAALPRTSADQFPVGRGMLIARRDIAKVQVAVPDAESA